MNKLLLIVILITKSIVLFSQSDLQDFTYELPDTVTEEFLIQDIIENGNIESYNQLYMLYCCSSIEKEILPYSLVMANKWNNPKGMRHVYSEMLSLYNCMFWGDIEIMDSLSRNFALKYLLMSFKTMKEKEQNKSSNRYLEQIKSYINRHVEQGYIRKENGNYVIVSEP